MNLRKRKKCSRCGERPCCCVPTSSNYASQAFCGQCGHFQLNCQCITPPNCHQCGNLITQCTCTCPKFRCLFCGRTLSCLCPNPVCGTCGQPHRPAGIIPAHPRVMEPTNTAPKQTKNGITRRRAYKNLTDVYQDTSENIHLDHLVPNLITSKMHGSDLHLPCIDIDLPIEAIPSKTAGHYHLYIEKPLTYEQYDKLLSVMAEVGIVEEGYWKAFQAQKMTLVRLPPIEYEYNKIKEQIAATGTPFKDSDD